MNAEETDKLINIVRSYSPLWDMKNKQYHSRNVQRNLWGKVAVEMGGDVTDLKKKWKGLRDSFRREHRKMLKSGQQAPDEFTSSWPFFESMMFLSDIVEPRKLKGNVSPATTHILEREESQEEEIRTEAGYVPFSEEENSTRTEVPSASTQLSGMAPPPNTPATARRKMLESEQTNRLKKKRIDKKCSSKAESYDSQFLEIEKEKLKRFSESVSLKSDSSYQFLLSLLPFLQRVPESRQLSVRNKLQQVLIDEHERYSTIQDSQSSHSSNSLKASGAETALNLDVGSQSSWTSESQLNMQETSSCCGSQPSEVTTTHAKLLYVIDNSLIVDSSKIS